MLGTYLGTYLSERQVHRCHTTANPSFAPWSPAICGRTNRHRVCPPRARVLTSAVPTNPDEPVTRIFIFSNSLYFVRRGQKPSSLHATQPARNGQVIEIFKFYLANEEVESFVVIQSPSATRNGERSG